MNLMLLAALLCSTADIESHESRVSLEVGLGSLAAVPGYGAAFETGLRVRISEHLAGAFDLGYGVLGSGQTAQDRWWLMPSMAATFAVSSARLELGFGLGLGTSSGYASLGAFVNAPFTPDWAFQLVPAARVHAGFAIPMSPRVTLFARLEAASLLLPGSAIGFRAGEDQHGSFANDTWLNLALGGRFGL